MTRSFFLIAGLLLFVLPGRAEDLSSAGGLEFFETRIRPVLAEKCYKCHAADSEKLKGGLQVDHRDHLMAGGDTGAALEPGDVKGSLLIESLRYKNQDLQMPPKERLNAKVVKDFERWVADGAPWPDEPVPLRDSAGHGEGFDLEKRRSEHWSWRPVIRPVEPKVSRETWPRQDLDKFVLREIESAGLRPAEEATRRVWLRRVYFDLIGLPPTPEAIESFEADFSPDDYEEVVNELLASPAFGEKWARHWMDLVRYAETYGHEFDYPIAFAHEYRDYLIRAFNADVPYDQFVTEQIAGDLLEGPRRNPEEGYDESILGTAFWYLHEATHAPTDVLANESDIMDNQIDVFGKSFLALTISCARCHDHKFDAVSTADYYAMTAYLHSSARQDYPMDPGRGREMAREQMAGLKQKADLMLEAAGMAETVPSSQREGVFEDFSAGEIPEGWSSSGAAFAGSGQKVGVRFNSESPLSIPGTIDSGLFGKAQVGSLRSPSFTLSSDRIFVKARGEKVSVRVIVDNYQMTKFNGLLFKGIEINDIDSKNEFKWMTLGGNLDKYIGHQVYLEIVDSGDGDIIIDEIRFPNGNAAPPGKVEAGEDFKVSEEVLAVIRQGEEMVTKLSKPRFAVAMAEGTAEGAQVHVRGSSRNLGEEVPRRFLTALGGGAGDRLDLAQQVVNSENPLTSRVMVNRIWHHLFGRGLVPSVDDFGPMGQPASHPKLLDWLASEFVEQDWSIKQLIRQMVLSSTYRQSSSSHPDVSPGALAEVDPDNELLSRMPVRRLVGEAIRDSILTVSGQLDAAMYGPSIPTYRTEFMTGRGGRKSGPVDGARRRSVYGAVYRNFLSPFMLTYDVPNPFGPKGRRSVSNVPAQSLVMMNDPFVVEQSRLWAELIEESEGTSTEKIEGMYLAALGRPPSGEEMGRVQAYMEAAAAAGSDAEQIWADLGHVVLNMKEFIYIY